MESKGLRLGYELENVLASASGSLVAGVGFEPETWRHSLPETVPTAVTIKKW